MKKPLQKAAPAIVRKRLQELNYSAATKSKFIGVLPTEPEWIRLPPDGVTEPWSSMQRGKLKQLADMKAVNAIRLPNEGENKKGVVLLRWSGPGGLKEYLLNLEREQNPEREPKAAAA
jgi:hypothetical protein